MRRVFARFFLLLSTALPINALADVIYVVRPQLGTGSANVLPQDAFSTSSTPSTGSPSNPATPTPDNGGYDFKSEDYGDRSGWTLTVTPRFNTTYNSFEMVTVNVPAPTTFDHCSPVDDVRPGLAAPASSIIDTLYNVGNIIFFRPSKAGRFGLRVNCPGSPFGVFVDIEINASTK